MNQPPEGSEGATAPSVGGIQEARRPNGKGTTAHQFKSKPRAHKFLLEVPVIGDPLGRKKDNMIRFYFENLNAICSHDKKVDKGKFFSSLLSKLEVDCFGAAETNLNWKITTRSPRNLLDLSMDIRSSFACGENEATTLKQQGGTCITMMEKYGQYVIEMGKDKTGLGRWTWI